MEKKECPRLKNETEQAHGKVSRDRTNRVCFTEQEQSWHLWESRPWLDQIGRHAANDENMPWLLAAFLPVWAGCMDLLSVCCSYLRVFPCKW